MREVLGGASASGFGRLSAWSDPRIRSRLEWYRRTATNEMPAKYLIARRIPIDLSLRDSGEGELWSALDGATVAFLALLDEIRAHRRKLRAIPQASPNLVDLCVELSRRMLSHCNFCRWDCRVDRSGTAEPGAKSKHGTCQLASATRVSSYFHHTGEELVYRGRMGSGTIFFTSCNMRCAFCQNGDISTDKDNGIPIDPRQLALMAWQLRREGCHNVNFVGGEVTIHLHTIVEAISLLDESRLRVSRRDIDHVLQAKADAMTSFPSRAENAHYEGELNVPVLWNSNFFMSPETMRILRVLVDVWLPDFKFGPGRCGVTLSRTPWYWETITANLSLIHGWGEDATIRHLVMPNHVECCTMPVLDWIAEHTPDLPVNVMDQYHPDTFCDPASTRYDAKYAGIARRPTAAEIEAAYRHAKLRGLAFESITFEPSTYGFGA
jgi:putative pyruvate formate lyase activating enzyme